MKLIMIFILTIFVSIHAQEMKQKPEEDSKFLDIKVDNPELQAEIYNLKKQYDSELNELKVQLGYPVGFNGIQIIDKRNDDRIIESFRRDNKLIE